MIGEDICILIRSWSRLVNVSGQIDQGDGAGSAGLRRRAIGSRDLYVNQTLVYKRDPETKWGVYGNGR
jgi:hypothetical protein